VFLLLVEDFISSYIVKNPSFGYLKLERAVLAFLIDGVFAVVEA
jgi:hypothetical protein